ncbi:uncharacterized protein LOC111345675 isoform X3 [Stylophora pistillata]|nr:uncharacterized protein LOC111345675 isoform X3 [Stylophora pistillata]
MALGILFNGGNNRTQQQPPYFAEVDQLFDHLQTAGKKPVHMSQQTLATLKQLKDEYEQNDIHEKDSIGHFVQRQALKLGLISRESLQNGEECSGNNLYANGRDVGAVQRGGGNKASKGGRTVNGAGKGARKAPQRQRMCGDCEENVATLFCPDCQPSLVLCDDCAVVLHRGVTRRNHHLKDVVEAPAPSKGYTPKAYRAPFAMLVAFHRAANEVHSKMSLTEDELKSRAQPLTNTDLEIKQGRWSGFDSMESALLKNELVQKEARTPKYSLMEKGQPLAARCSEFDYAVQNLKQAASIPTIPIMAVRPVFRSRQVCLLVDSEEPSRERFVRVVQQHGMSAKTRKLPVGDFLWVLLPPGVNPDTVRDMPDQELVLPMVVERKTWDDLWSSLKSTRFLNQVKRMKNCGLENLFYLVEGNPKELKGNPGPEVARFLQDKLDSLVLEEQFLVNRTGSWMKTVEWLCHLTNLTIEVLQSEGSPQLKTYSEFSRGRKSQRNLANLDAVSANPVAATVWSASEFTDIIRSHCRGGMELHSLPVRGGNGLQEERSLIVIQGLTLYNKQCHKLLDKALADLLNSTHETAEACVQKHLQGVTDQLVHEDVPQWYILWLQVSKGAMVRRTETAEETAEILSKFYQMSGGVIDVPLPTLSDGKIGDGKIGDGKIGDSKIGDGTQFGIQPEERLPGDELVFASDSQEEDAMIQQALQASQYQAKVVEVRPRAVQPFIPSSSDCELQKYSLESINEREQLVLAMNLSKVEYDSERSYKDINPNQSGKMTARSFTADKHIHSNPKTKVDVFKPKCTTVFGGNTKASTAHDELEKVLKQSLEEFENLKKIQEEKRKMSDANRDLQKALELSRLEYTQLQCSVTCDELIERQVHNGSCLSNKDRELERALDLSKLEAQTAKKDHCTGMVEKACSRGEKQSREREGINFVESDLQKALELSKGEYEQGKTKASMNLNAGGKSMETSTLEGKEPGSNSLSSNEGDLAKAIQISRNDCDKVVEHNGDGVLDKEEQYNRGKGTMVSLQVEENAAKVLIQSFDGSRGHSSGSDLHRVLELSRGEYPKTTRDEKDKHTDADVVLQGSNAALVQSRERHELDQNAKYSTPVQGCVANGDVVPSRVPLELDQDHDYPCTFPALGHSTPAGSAKCSAILLDSQELGDERESMDASELQIEEVAEDIPANKKQLCPAEGRSVDDDYSYALKLQKELNSYEQSFDGPVRRNKTSAAAAEVQDQLKLYRESQKEKYGTRAGKGDKSSRGIDFRRNVAAIACGKPVQIGVANPISRSELSQRKQDPPRDHRDMSSPKKRIEREGKKLHYSPKKLGFHREDVFVIRDEDDDDIEPKPGGFPFSSRPSSSGSSTFERVHPRPPSFSGAMPSPSHPFHRSPCEPKDSSTNHVSSSSDKPMGPKCSSCGTVGHNKNSKVCPNYFSAEAVQRREEQSRKRKAKREEEEREFNDRLGALAAQRLAIEDRSRTLGEQLDELRRQSQNMANTQKMVEDAIKRRRKR